MLLQGVRLHGAQCFAELPKALDGGIKEVECPHTRPSHTP